MEPTLRSGDVLLVRAGALPKVGDLVVVRLPERPGLAVKRAVRHEPDGWWVERDNPREGVDSWSVGAVPDAGRGGAGRAATLADPACLEARPGCGTMAQSCEPPEECVP